MTLQEQLKLNERNKNAAEKMYFNGITDPYEIASILGCPVQHVFTWIESETWGVKYGEKKKEVEEKSGSSFLNLIGTIIFWIIVIAVIVQTCD